jgi:hypothetical protein
MMARFKIEKNKAPAYVGDFAEWNDPDVVWDDDVLWGHLYTYENNPKGDIIIFKVKGK